jgi:thiol-disulfide isomerase/thioredoxin
MRVRMATGRTTAGWLTAALVFMAGCDAKSGASGGSASPSASGKGAATNASATSAAATNTAVPTVPAAALDVGLQFRNYDELQTLIASKKGKVVVVDVWSTNCQPCMDAFPGLVNLHKKYGPEKVACISLCADYSGLGKPEEFAKEPLKFLKEQGATFDNLYSTEADEALYKKLGIPSVPSILVYDTEGKLAKKWEAETPYTVVEEVVKPLVN